MYKENKSVEKEKEKLARKVIDNLSWLPSSYRITPVALSLWYDADITLGEIKDSSKENLITLYFKEDGAESRWYKEYNIDTLIDYVDHISKSIDIMKLCKNHIELTYEEQEILNKATVLYKDMHKQLMKVCPKYKRKHGL